MPSVHEPEPEPEQEARGRVPFRRRRFRRVALPGVALAALAGLALGSASLFSSAHAADNYLKYNGGAHGTFTQTPTVYLVFWGSQWGGNGGDVQAQAEGFLKGLGTNGDTWSTILTQYCSGIPAGSTSCPADAQHIPYPDGNVFGGTWFDDRAPAGETPDYAAEGAAAAEHFNADPATAIFVILAPNTTAGGGNAWHSASTGYHIISLPSQLNNTIVLSHEYAEELADTDAGWTSPGNEEIADMCGPGGSVQFSTGSFAVTSLWSNAANGCVISG